MSQTRQTWNLILGLTFLGLSACSAIASAGTGSPDCTAKVKSQVAALTTKNGHSPSNSMQENLLAKCSEAQVGLQFEGLLARHSQEGTRNKEARCETSVKYAVQTGRETSGRSQDELLSLCLSLPSSHDPNCGFSSGADAYSEMENQSCVSKPTGITGSVVAKVDKSRARKFDNSGTGSGTDDGSGITGGTTAQ